ncbi:MAG TPA: ATP-binding protein [Chthoniobacteraceae bacterium]|jgi:anti-sigma regulatory factor (Ser/Thr protein kinase)
MNAAPTSNKREIEFASHPGNLSLVRDFVRQFLKTVDFPDLEKDLIVLGLDEACTNVIRYAYHHEPTHLICLACEQVEKGVVFRLRDYGMQAELSQLQGRPLDLVQPGGLGIHLIRRAFTEVDYKLKKQGTELVLAKHFMATGDGCEASAK